MFDLKKLGGIVVLSGSMGALLFAYLEIKRTYNLDGFELFAVNIGFSLAAISAVVVYALWVGNKTK